MPENPEKVEIPFQTAQYLLNFVRGELRHPNHKPDLDLKKAAFALEKALQAEIKEPDTWPGSSPSPTSSSSSLDKWEIAFIHAESLANYLSDGWEFLGMTWGKIPGDNSKEFYVVIGLRRRISG